jgi:ribosomal protein L21E
MKTLNLSCLLVLFASFIQAQDVPFAPVSMAEILNNKYVRDTSASAVVLREFGEAFIENGDYHLIFRYHARIKILKKNGLDHANIEIPLYKQDNNIEKLISVRASSFNLENNRVTEEVLQDKDIFMESVNKYWNQKKFAIPNVRVGSVIDFSYSIESPFIYNFRTWEFQSDTPKMESEFWASLPGIYVYNITLKGYLKLTRNESRIVPKCLGDGATASADCALTKFGMKNIPAFVEEDYMTSKKNFLSSIHFELSEIHRFNGSIDKVTKEWKDAEQELRQESRFGIQLKRGKDIGEQVKALIENESDELAKAKKVYEFIKGWYLWNETYGKYSEFGIKKAFDGKTGNVGDINLSLIAAMRFAGLNVEPVILSTRENGLPIEVHPVLSDFNYVIAKVNIGDQVYLADATEKYYPFGILPERCINGKGRVMAERAESYWIELKAAEKRKTLSVLTLKLEKDGIMRGSLQTTFIGYDAVNKRQEIQSFTAQQDYINDLKNVLSQYQVEVTGFQLDDVADMGKPLKRLLNIEIRAYDNLEVKDFLFNPFILEKWTENPFKSKERQYPVDFGIPLDRVTVFNLEYPAEFEVLNIPEKVALALPNSGGRFIYQASNQDNKLSMNHSLMINKPVFTSSEYQYLKELFNMIIQVQNGELIFRKKA